MKRLMVFSLALATTSLAFAQTDVALDPALWFSNPVFGVGAVVGFVEWLRKRFPQIDGPVMVPAVALAVGTVGGALGQLFGMQIVEPFNTFAVPFAGMAYGFACAGTGVLGVNLIELASSKVGKALFGIVKANGEVVEANPARVAAARRLVR